MSSDTDKHHALLTALKEVQGKGDGSFEQAVTDAFEHVFDHLARLNAHVSQGGSSGEERLLEDGESATLR
ncbi:MULTISPECIES: hypothetical protein [unclassified Methylobacterium]|uniref:hypothetical protein n=1 Tax=unclassified Methylobacterium TaxID=2615210 RepID=UPI002269C804|nr:MULTISPECIES: hypothetical protein [unclassified Methylobacterium]